MVQSVDEVLKERGERYGVFMGQARIAQSIHMVLDQAMQMTGKTRFDFAPDQLESMNMIVNKIARIYNGDNHYSDSWRDIAGYATLVADRLDNDNKKLLESQNETTQSEPCCDECCTVNTETTSEPTRIVVQDGNHAATTETDPGVPGTPRQ